MDGFHCQAQPERLPFQLVSPTWAGKAGSEGPPGPETSGHTPRSRVQPGMLALRSPATPQPWVQSGRCFKILTVHSMRPPETGAVGWGDAETGIHQ